MDSRKNLYGTIAGNIKKERKRLSISQVQLAEKADVSVDTIKSVENGRRAMGLDTYLNIMQALGMEPLSLMGWGKTGGVYWTVFIPCGKAQPGGNRGCAPDGGAEA